jgi:predicted nucleic acid-binding protein
MLVVADTTPINYLVQVEAISVLPSLFGSVLIPPMVEAELLHPQTPSAVQEFMNSRPAWLRVEAPATTTRRPPLDPGEEQAISLAESLHADALLIDELKGRKAATSAGIRVIGTVGVLELAAASGLIDLPTVLQRLQTTVFRIDARIIRAAIERDAKRRPK